jgi:hypothetical protein
VLQVVEQQVVDTQAVVVELVEMEEVEEVVELVYPKPPSIVLE